MRTSTRFGVRMASRESEVCQNVVPLSRQTRRGTHMPKTRGGNIQAASSCGQRTGGQGTPSQCSAHSVLYACRVWQLARKHRDVRRTYEPPNDRSVLHPQIHVRAREHDADSLDRKAIVRASADTDVSFKLSRIYFNRHSVFRIATSKKTS